jgi:ankyrin repeat protein
MVELQERLYNHMLFNNIDEVDRLLEQGVDPNYISKRGDTLIYIATLMGRNRIVPKLLIYGADYTIENMNDDVDYDVLGVILLLSRIHLLKIFIIFGLKIPINVANNCHNVENKRIMDSIMKLSPLKIALTYNLLEELKQSLKLGKINFDNLEEIIDIRNNIKGYSSCNRKDILNITGYWKPLSHFYYHKTFRYNVYILLLIFNRNFNLHFNSNITSLILPSEIVLYVIGFLKRKDWIL